MYSQSASSPGDGYCKFSGIGPYINNIIRRAWKNDQAPQWLAQGEKEGLPLAKYFSAQLREMVADSILRDSAAARVQSLGRVFLDPFGFGEPPESLRPFFIGARSRNGRKRVRHFLSSVVTDTTGRDI